MSVFGSIMSSIFGSPAAAASAAPQPQPGPQPNGGAKARASAPPPGPQATAKTQSAPAAPTAQVDVAAVMDQLAKEAGQKLDWRRSIVDLMKLLKLDSGLTARKKLAQELSYTGDTKDTAAMNIWLHKQVMIKLADNGGKVPAELKH
jgi:hypothetical protein